MTTYDELPDSAHSPPALSPIEISLESDEPLYRQLRRALEHQILSGVLNPDVALPSSRALSHELGLSRNTVNAAIQELVATGLIEARPRSGHFINTTLLNNGSKKLDRARLSDGSIDWESKIRAIPDRNLPEITKTKNWQSYPYPFVAGQVDPDEFPRLAWARALRTAMDPEHLPFSVRDAIDEDDPLLTGLLCHRVLPSRGIHVSPENVLITAGSQQGLDLLAQLLVGPDTTVGVEDPGYVDAKHAFTRVGGQLVPLSVDAQGMVPPWKPLDIVYVTPSHHSPTNVTLDPSRRLQLLTRMRETNSLIIEDDYDSEFRYRGKPTPALKALPHSDHVIYLGSFSKFLAPGLRLGYIVAEPELIERMRTHRRYSIRHVPGHTQRAMALLIDSGQFHRTISRRRTQLRKKWETLTSALEEHLPWAVPFPAGGVSVWIQAPPQLNCRELAEECLRRGVVIEPGDPFFLSPEDNLNFFRLGFAAIDLDSIEPGVLLLSEAIASLLDHD
ncbi:PLP-dependent aminotransferase family protein [Brevibacterium sp. RIT 803]|uniref:MocR-like pyridoxine biosynthesis transcription factor PdxR n=1 Tax=Brevibacterium sp. RIT 803 TaxID=2810210 RepID=UPI001951FDBF|nr:PLP-dependent aminotransferase family protein [Brevibacterium sp. RIT 803]MBM6588441.1 PLP-dependent aminotransferase family protein [Brevibacterium sp. RIT 803]